METTNETAAEKSEKKPDTAPLDRAKAVATKLRARLSAAVKGRDDVIELVLTALLADGHVLLEDYPGSGKTTLARALGNAVTGGGAPSSPGAMPPDPGIASFRRIQFTPDLLPSDITGTSVFEHEHSRFV